MKNDWKVWLNANGNAKYNYIHIGKDIRLEGDSGLLFVSDNISIIGYGKIYNEPELWKILEKKEDITHSLGIIVELYKKYGFEDMLELIEGDYSFLLLDYNINGDESWLYVVKDPFGIYPLYYYENQNNTSKKVQFNIEMKYYGFSSSEYSANYEYKSFISGHYQVFSHSHKVSAIWKRNHRPKLFYKLPFYSVYNDYDTFNTIDYQTKEIRIAIEKRIRWISYKKNKSMVTDDNIKIGVLCLNPVWEKMNMITYLEQSGFDIIPITPLNIQNKDNSVVFEWSRIMHLENQKDIGSNILQIEYMEREYPTIITRLKLMLNSNDPYVIRSHFIPMIIAKYLNENMPEIKHVFLGEQFTFDWIEKKYLERRKWIMQLYLDERLRGWTQIFLSYGIELYMPFLDRMLIQNIKPVSIL
jgi:hypothetical protein